MRTERAIRRSVRARFQNAACAKRAADREMQKDGVRVRLVSMRGINARVEAAARRRLMRATSRRAILGAVARTVGASLAEPAPLLDDACYVFTRSTDAPLREHACAIFRGVGAAEVMGGGPLRSA